MSSLLALLLAGPASAADWSTLMATEEGREDRPLQVMGFVQPQVEGMLGGAVTGLEAEALQPSEGERPVFNTVANGGAWGFKLHRARLGVRGSIPRTDQKVTYFLLAEGGETPMNRTSALVLTDASVTLSYLPGARVRLGQVKLPVMEEIVQGVAVGLEFVHFSTTLQKLLLENPVQDGAYAGPAGGFRDVGVQVFDGFQGAHLAGAYAVMVSNGAGILSVDPDEAKDVSARAEVAWVTAGEIHQPRREEVKLGGWWLEGQRTLDEAAVRRVRRGAFLHVEQGAAWGLVEVAQGEGALEVGVNPPFPGGAVLVVPDGVGWGAVAQGGVRLDLGEGGPELGLKARYDVYHQQTELPEARRIFRTTTLGVEVDPAPKVRLQANYEVRRLAAPDGTPDARTIAASMGDRVTAQVTARF